MNSRPFGFVFGRTSLFRTFLQIHPYAHSHYSTEPLRALGLLCMDNPSRSLIFQRAQDLT